MCSYGYNHTCVHFLHDVVHADTCIYPIIMYHSQFERVHLDKLKSEGVGNIEAFVAGT